VVRAGGGEGVGPFCKIGGEEGASKGKMEDAGAPNKGHRKPSKNTWDVEERKPQFRGPVKVRGRGGDLVLLEDPEGVRRRVVNVKVTQRERGEIGRGKNNIRGNGAGIVETTLRAVRDYDRKTSRGGVKQTVSGEKVQSDNITPPEKTRQEGNSS